MSKPGLSGLAPGWEQFPLADAERAERLYYAGVAMEAVLYDLVLGEGDWAARNKKLIKEQQFPYCWGTVGSAFFFHHLYVWNGAPWGCAEPKPGSVKLVIWDDPPYPRDP